MGSKGQLPLDIFESVEICDCVLVGLENQFLVFLSGLVRQVSLYHSSNSQNWIFLRRNSSYMSGIFLRESSSRRFVRRTNSVYFFLPGCQSVMDWRPYKCFYKDDRSK